MMVGLVTEVETISISSSTRESRAFLGIPYLMATASI